MSATEIQTIPQQVGTDGAAVMTPVKTKNDVNTQALDPATSNKQVTDENSENSGQQKELNLRHAAEDTESMGAGVKSDSTSTPAEETTEVAKDQAGKPKLTPPFPHNAFFRFMARSAL